MTKAKTSKHLLQLWHKKGVCMEAITEEDSLLQTKQPIYVTQVEESLLIDSATMYAACWCSKTNPWRIKSSLSVRFTKSITSFWNHDQNSPLRYYYAGKQGFH